MKPGSLIILLTKKRMSRQKCGCEVPMLLPVHISYLRSWQTFSNLYMWSCNACCCSNQVKVTALICLLCSASSTCCCKQTSPVFQREEVSAEGGGGASQSQVQLHHPDLWHLQRTRVLLHHHRVHEQWLSGPASSWGHTHLCYIGGRVLYLIKLYKSFSSFLFVVVTLSK